MNWGTFGLIGIATLFVLVFVVARRGWSPIGLVIATSNWLVASLHVVAPLRGLMDPSYVGYSFGLLSAERGWRVAALAGSVLIGGALSAAIAARNSRGPIMAVVVIFNGVVLLAFGLPLIQRAVTDPSRYVMQFGEFLTVPPMIALPVALVLVLVPTLLGIAWGTRRLYAGSSKQIAPVA
jgi:hypothetical protein